MELTGLIANSDFETFLKLLTTQMENQDPLKPLESTEFVAQLASFSAVEQQILTNTRLSEISSAMTSSHASQAADWLGKRVQAPSATNYDGEEVNITWDRSPSATRSTLEVLDEAGSRIAALNVPIGQTEYSWDGQMDDGTAAPDGVYSFKIKHFDGDEVIDATLGRTYNQVKEVHIESSGLKLVLDGGATVNPEQVSRIGYAA